MISPSDPELLASLREHEGWRAKPYHCTAGALTIGYGHNIDAHPVPSASLLRWREEGLSQREGEALLLADVAEAFEQACTLPCFTGVSEPAQRVLVEMVYQLGLGGVRGFKRLLGALERGDYVEAAKEGRDSKWHRQTTRRAETLMGRLENA